jgi:hypothetical protein
MRPLPVRCAGRRSRSRRRVASAWSNAARQRPYRPHPLTADQQRVLAGWLDSANRDHLGSGVSASGLNPAARSSANPPRQLASRLYGTASAAPGRDPALRDHRCLRACTTICIFAIYRLDTLRRHAAVIACHFVRPRGDGAVTAERQSDVQRAVVRHHRSHLHRDPAH